MKRNIVLAMAIVMVGFFLAFSAQAESQPLGWGNECAVIETELSTGAEMCGEGFLGAGATATVQQHLMALYPPPACPTPPEEVTKFKPGDKVMNWVYLTGCTGGDTFRWDWYAPDGTHYYLADTISGSGNWCLSCSFLDGIPDKKGGWDVDFEYEGVTKYTDNFTVDGGLWNSVYNKLFGENVEDLRTLRGFRDEVLCANPTGKAYVDRLYDRSHEVALILLLNPGLRVRTMGVLDALVPEIESILQGEEAVLSGRMVRKIDRLLDAFAKKASPELQSLIEDVKAELGNKDTMMLFGISQQ